MRVAMLLPAAGDTPQREINFYGIPIPPVGASVVLDSSRRNRSYVVKHLVWFLADMVDNPADDHVRVVLQATTDFCAERKSKNAEKGTL